MTHAVPARAKREVTLLGILLALATPAQAAECPKRDNYAVMFKMEEMFGQEYPAAEDLPRAERGNRHWRLRQIEKWALTLPAGCIKDNWLDWINFGLSSLQDAEDKKPTDDASERQQDYHEQDEGHILAHKIPAPP